MSDVTDVRGERIVEVRELKQGRLRKQNEAVNFSHLMNKIQPESLTKTVVIEARTDVRLLATLEKFFLSAEVLVQTKSELMRASLELLHDWLVQRGLVRPFDEMSFHEAYDLLARFGNLNKGGQNRRRLAAALARESVQEEYREAQSRPVEPIVEQPTAEYMEQLRRETRKRASDAGLMVEQDKEEQLPDSASLFIPPAIVVED